MELIARHCPICKCSDSPLYAKSNAQLDKLDAFAFSSRKYPERMHYDLKLCNACDVLYSDNVLPPSTVANEYENAAYDSSEEARFAARTYAKYVPASLKRGKALDIGTGGGDFLVQLKRLGFSPLEGVEPSRAAIETAAPDIKPLIRKGMFDSTQHTKDSYDLITCFQTLEHVENPLEFSKQIYELLDSGGAYFTITHNFKGMLNRFMSFSSPIYDIEHYQLFSKKSLHKLLDSCGFKDIHVFSIQNTYPLHYWLKLLPLPQKFAATFVSLSKCLKFGHIPMSMNVGNIGVIGFK